MCPRFTQQDGKYPGSKYHFPLLLMRDCVTVLLLHLPPEPDLLCLPGPAIVVLVGAVMTFVMCRSFSIWPPLVSVAESGASLGVEPCTMGGC